MELNLSTMYRKLNKDSLMRSNSICPTPEAILLDLVKTNDTDNMKRLVGAKPDLLEFVYTPEFNKPILLIALTEDDVDCTTIETLIDLGADLYYSSEIDEEWQAIHFAAYRTNLEILQVVVDRLNNPGDVNSLAKGNNALHVLIKHGRCDSPREFTKCVEFLIKSGIDVNCSDPNGVSPILWAAKKSQKNTIKTILENSFVPVDLDSHQSRKKTARDIIISENLYDGVLPSKIEPTESTETQILFEYIKSQNEKAFVAFKKGDIYDLVDATGSYSTTLLQMACEKGLKNAVKHLIDKGADPNKTTEKNRKTPLEITAENGFYHVFDVLVNNPKTCVAKDVLITLLKYIDNDRFPGVDHSKCYQMLVDALKQHKIALDVNASDATRNTPLHYAVRYADAEKVEDLLCLGASLGAKNRYGVMPIQDIEPYVLEKHLDRCIEFDVKGKKIDKEDFCVTYNYRTIIPPPSTSNETRFAFDVSDPEATMTDRVVHYDLVAETEVIAYMSRAPEFKHLLKHPVIVSFSFLKWHRIRWLFYVNLAFYVAFFTSLVVYIFSDYVNVNEEKSTLQTSLSKISWLFLVVTFCMLFLREVFQIVVSPSTYLKNFENYIESLLVVLTSCILFANCSDDSKKILSSVSILSAAFELVLMLGQHPKFSTNVVMLKTVSRNFFKFLAWYSLLIIAFAMSFYIIFTNTDHITSNNTTENVKQDDDDKDDDFFVDPGKSIFKTIIMLTGEFDAGSINFKTFPVTSEILFTLFIFMIAIILLNLLNGLAVSDTQMIKNDAELVGHIARAQQIRYVESMLLGNLFPTKLTNKINDVCCCFPVNRDVSYSITRSLAKRCCLFPHYLPNYELTVFLNKRGQIALPSYKKTSLLGKNCVGICKDIYLDRDTVKRTTGVVQMRREALRAKNEEVSLRTMLQDIEKSIVKIGDNINNECKFEIYMLHKKLDSIRQQNQN